MSHNEKEIALSRRLHELGVRPEIRYGDFYMDVYGRPTLCVYASASPAHHPYPGEVDFLLWSWSRCREWLKEKGWTLYVHDDFIAFNQAHIIIENRKESQLINSYGQTDLECALAVMCQVAEGK